jgi:adenylate kinase family enzyme
VSADAPERPRRVAVIGTSGAGKTTIARQLADRLDVRHIELDALFWLPDWQEPDRAAFRATVVGLLDEPGGWVLDGNYSTIRDAVLERADTVLWLDLPMRTCVWRVTHRAVSRARSRELLWGTNREPWRNVVGRNSLAWWVITTHGRRRRETEKRFRDPALAGIRVHRFRSSRAAEAWLASV